MILRSIYIQDFRNYTHQKFDFSDTFTVIIGPNTAGKTNLSETIHMLCTGKSFRTSTDLDMIAFHKDIARIQGLFASADEEIKVEVLLASSSATGGRFHKKFLVNGVAKSRIHATGFLPVVLFRPEELDIVTDGPALRRGFLDDILEQVDRVYEESKNTYERALRQRNALLRFLKENGGKRDEKEFAYWDNLLIENGQYIISKRKEFLDFINTSVHEIFSLQTSYDISTISQERLDQYKMEEIGAGVTLVGPHRDDFLVNMKLKDEDRSLRHFGSRGQQRLAVLQLKFLQIAFIQQVAEKSPLLVLDDIFSELDSKHIQLVLEKSGGCQIILTTTHREFIPKKNLKEAAVIELEP